MQPSPELPGHSVVICDRAAAQVLSVVDGLQHDGRRCSAWVCSGPGSQCAIDTMIAMEKADTALRLTMKVRNKVVEAYQRLMRMQV